MKDSVSMIPLKEATASKHSEAEKMPFNQRMFQGLLSKEEYLLYLQQQLAVFEVLESIELPHPDLQRADKVKNDMQEIISEVAFKPEVLSATREYVSYLSSLTREEQMPHIYLNYLALLFGGQMMKKKVPSSGAMYDFVNPKEAIMSIRAIQRDEWADEVNRGFAHNIQIFEELENYCQKLALKN